MAKSPEYPDLTWVPPKAFGSGRDGKAVRFIVVHYTAGAERNTSAEDGASYDQRRTDGTSTHYFVDSNSVIQCVRTSDRGNAARAKGNRLGIQYELCGTVQTRAQWLDAASLATLKNAARQIARDCRKHGIPVRRLSTLETRAAWSDFPRGPKGIVGHVDCTNAFPEDGGDHTDPGPAFPWDVFLPMIQSELTALSKPTEDEMDAAETAKVLDDTLRGAGPKVGDHAAGDVVRRWNAADGSEVPLTDPNPYMSLAYTAGYLGRQIAVIRNGVTALLAKEQGGDVDEGAIAALVLSGLTAERLAAAITAAGLTAQTIADALPDELAEQVADVLGRRISGTA
jgi:N-acetyl-anhydromuramyl-L-alanine amidase AmpD